MKFFGEAVDSDHIPIVIAPMRQLNLKQVCLDASYASNQGQLSLYVKTASKKHGVILCHVSSSLSQSSLSVSFDHTDSPVTIWSTGSGKMAGGVLHVTGTWEEKPAAVVTQQQSTPSSVVSGRKRDISNVEEPKSVTVVAPTPPSAPASKKQKQNSRVVEIVSTAVVTEASIPTPVESDVKPAKKDKKKGSAGAGAATPAAAPETSSTPAKASKKSTSSVENIVEVLAATVPAVKVNTKKWNVKPQNDEGIVVPVPRQKLLRLGVLATDFVLGKGWLVLVCIVILVVAWIL